MRRRTPACAQGGNLPRPRGARRGSERGETSEGVHPGGCPPERPGGGSKPLSVSGSIRLRALLDGQGDSSSRPSGLAPGESAVSSYPDGASDAPSSPSHRAVSFLLRSSDSRPSGSHPTPCLPERGLSSAAGRCRLGPPSAALHLLAGREESGRPLALAFVSSRSGSRRAQGAGGEYLHGGDHGFGTPKARRGVRVGDLRSSYSPGEAPRREGKARNPPSVSWGTRPLLLRPAARPRKRRWCRPKSGAPPPPSSRAFS